MTPSLLASRYLSHLDPSFLFLAGDGDPLHSPPGYGLEPWVALPLILVGFVVLLVKLVRGSLPRRPLLLLLSALVLYPVPGSLTLPPTSSLNAAPLLPILSLLAATGVVAVIGGVRAVMNTGEVPSMTVRAATVACAALLVVVYAPGLGGWYVNYFDRYPKTVTEPWQYGLGEAIGYARQHEAEYDVIHIDGRDMNQPYIYVLFYARWSPSEVHGTREVQREIGRYRFQTPPQLPPGLRAEDLRVVHISRSPEEQPMYEVRGGQAGSGERVLVVRKV